MARSPIGRSLVLALVACTGVMARSDDRRPSARRAGISNLPSVMFWAWQRREDLRGIDPSRAGVAFLAETWFVGESGPRIEHRKQPLLVDPGVSLLAVVRIEVPVRPLPAFSAGQIQSMAESLSRVVDVTGAAGLQIDYDATLSEHGFYRDLLRETRLALRGRPLSMTALLSWCTSDARLLGGAVDEAVPMLFRLGTSEDSRLKALAAAGVLRSDACGGAVGISLDEPTPRLAGGRRLYVFNPSGWTPAVARRVLTGIGARQ